MKIDALKKQLRDEMSRDLPGLVASLGANRDGLSTVQAAIRGNKNPNLVARLTDLESRFLAALRSDEAVWDRVWGARMRRLGRCGNGDPAAVSS